METSSVRLCASIVTFAAVSVVPSPIEASVSFARMLLVTEPATLKSSLSPAAPIATVTTVLWVSAETVTSWALIVTLPVNAFVVSDSSLCEYEPPMPMSLAIVMPPLPAIIVIELVAMMRTSRPAVIVPASLMYACVSSFA